MAGGDSGDDELWLSCRVPSEEMLESTSFEVPSLSLHSDWLESEGTPYLHSSPALRHRRQCGRSSPHFSLRDLHVLHPVRTFGAQVRVRARASVVLGGLIRHCVMNAFWLGCTGIVAEAWLTSSVLGLGSSGR